LDAWRAGAFFLSLELAANSRLKSESFSLQEMELGGVEGMGKARRTSKYRLHILLWFLL
jgi:hypothetical protein